MRGPAATSGYSPHSRPPGPSRSEWPHAAARTTRRRAARATAAAARSTWSPTRLRRPPTSSDSQPGFQETEEGSGVTFKNSFGASGDQSRAVEAGLPADLVHLPLEPDMTRLVEAGLIAEDYKDTEYNGGTQNSVVVIGVRPGNPENINSWDDLVSGDIEVITPEPVHLRRRALEPDGRLRQPDRPGQVRGRGARLHRPDPRAHPCPGRERARLAADVHRRQGRRLPLLRERGARRDRRPARSSSTSSPTRRS